MIRPYVFIAAPTVRTAPAPLSTLAHFREFHQYANRTPSVREWSEIVTMAQAVHDSIRATDPDGARFLRSNFDALR